MAKMIVVMLLLSLFVANLQSVSVGHAQVDTTATIAAWNIKGLDVDPISETRAKQIAKGIALLDPEVVALAEVNPDSIVNVIVEELNNASTGAKYEPPLIMKQKDGVVQNLALIYKTGVLVSSAELIRNSDLSEEPRSRQALAAKVKIGNFDFLLVAVHLKSSRDDKSRTLRTKQINVIAKYIKDKTVGSGDPERDVLVVGDYNMIPQQDAVNFDALSSNGFLRFPSYDLTGPSHIQRCQPLEGNLLDGYAVSAKYTTEYVEGSLRIFPITRALRLPCKDYVSEVSDHFPLIARFMITAADDD
jgi:endonuclease/exonuclease/phosphatase family metal-dependent hydrolase